MCRTCTPTSILTKSCSKKSPANFASQVAEEPPLRAAFLRAASRGEKVFNTTVENSVEKHECIFVSDATRDGSAFCTGASAGTLVLQPAARRSRFLIQSPA